MNYDPRSLTPGRFGYRCRHCANIAFAFPGDDFPPPGTYLEDVEACQRGPYASERRSRHICQHCGAQVSCVNGILDSACIVDIDEYAASLEKRLNTGSARNTGTSRQLRRPEIKVDREYMGCGYTQEESDAIREAREALKKPKYKEVLCLEKVPGGEAVPFDGDPFPSRAKALSAATAEAEASPDVQFVVFPLDPEKPTGRSSYAWLKPEGQGDGIPA